MEIQDAKQARPHCELIAELLDSRQPKTEREHAAVREIERLRAELAECKEMLDEASGYVREDVRRMGDEWSGYIIDAAIDSAVALLDRIDAARKGEGE